MRKTQLWSNKEMTPEFYNPRVTYDGRYTEIVTPKRNATMGRSKRFVQYEHESRRMGNEVGPGTYQQFHRSIEGSRIKGTPVYKKFYRQRDLNDNWYFYINESYRKSTHFRSTF